MKKAWSKLKPPPGTPCELCGKRRPLVPDHDHITGELRGWLCTGCNTGIGHLGDDVEGLATALAYLKRARRREERTKLKALKQRDIARRIARGRHRVSI